MDGQELQSFVNIENSLFFCSMAYNMLDAAARMFLLKRRILG